MNVILTGKNKQKKQTLDLAASAQITEL